VNRLSISSEGPVERFLQSLRIDTAAGIPCGVLRPFVAYFMASERVMHIAAQSEPEAVSITAGALLGGRRPIVYMQNSGLLKSLNEYASLLIPYRLPIPAIVSYRGCPGEDAPQHLAGGRATEAILKILGIPYRELSSENAGTVAGDLFQEMERSGQPGIILVRRGIIGNPIGASTPHIPHQPQRSASPRPAQAYRISQSHPGPRDGGMEREEALDAIIVSSACSDAIFSTTGLISRSLYERHDSPNQCYLTGSFGFVSSVGCGFALAKPDVITIVVDGDGSLLTNLSTLVTIGNARPRNLIHIVIDNNAYASCSGEPTCAPAADFGNAALLHGYARAYVADSPPALGAAIGAAKSADGPALIHARIRQGGRRDFARPLDLPWIAQRFKRHFS
jgi:phosphonopyruvate decarboxylase